MLDFSAGGGGHPLEDNHIGAWSVLNNMFSDEELTAITGACLQLDLNHATVGTVASRSQYRRSAIRFFYPSEHSYFVFERVAAGIKQVNDKDFKFDITGLNEGLQFTRYSEDDQGHYTWHVDTGPRIPVRKLSISIQLSDPTDYDGGDLQFRYGAEVATAPKTRGAAIIFPSYVLHRVTPVTRGTRYSLVGWVTGPAFK
jgi:PKHD-type hydroxylase